MRPDRVSDCRMIPELDEVARLRKALGMTQTALAKRAGVSQSTIVKIERKQMNPSYDVVQRIVNVLQSEVRRQERKALVEQVQTRRVQFVEAQASVETAAQQMRRHQFSQFPVLSDGRAVGSISDRTITGLIVQGRNPHDFGRIPVEEVMEPPFPLIDAKTPVELAAGLLRHYNAVLVTARGEITGIVTKSDLMKLL